MASVRFAEYSWINISREFMPPKGDQSKDGKVETGARTSKVFAGTRGG